MKNVKFLATAIFATVLFVSCSNDDDTPEPVNEEEVITTLTVTLSPNGGGVGHVFPRGVSAGLGSLLASFLKSGDL